MDKKKINVIIFAFASVIVFVGLLLVIAYNTVAVIEGISSKSLPVQEKLAAGEKIKRGDPLISDAKLRYPQAMISDPQWGDKKAKVTMFVYSELLCPECIGQLQTLKSIKKKYNDQQVRIVWKGVAKSPTELLHQQAAYCALVQGSFWPFVDRLINNSDEPSRLLYTEIASELGLSVDKFNECLDQELVLDKIYKNNQDAVDLGIDSVPYFFIEYYPYRGPLTEQELTEVIEAELKK